ncbi:MAG TPA: GerMN domain-containing protein [Gammaproteobacteria bacterium]|jgi:spore germination protein GerM|nr:GerMN domain-containing protein [Candidatus Hydrogenedentota bacterium]HJP36533.1 GerMN domain-containing protein [Gammaproteobacteria bacterium]
MSEATPANVVKTALFALWGMATLVLLFSVALLVYEMIQKGRNPLEFTILQEAQRVNIPEVVDVEGQETRGIQVYFGDVSGSTLVGETRRVKYNPEHTLENCRTALEALIGGPETPEAVRTLSPGTKIRGIYLLEYGELAVDFSRDLEAGHIPGVSSEMLMVKSIVTTLTQSAIRGRDAAAVRKIRFLFEGSPPGESFPVHIDLSEPVLPKPDWRPLAPGLRVNG